MEGSIRNPWNNLETNLIEGVGDIIERIIGEILRKNLLQKICGGTLGRIREITIGGIPEGFPEKIVQEFVKDFFYRNS